jgi:hypothetical protein
MEAVNGLWAVLCMDRILRELMPPDGILPLVRDIGGT